MKKSTISWNSLFLVTFLAAYLYILNEWLFIVTKPSFLNELDFLQQLDIYFSTSALIASLCFLGLLPLVILSLLPASKSYLDILIKVGTLLPAGIFATLIVIMTDNFTYTVFKWGIVLTEGWSRGLYGLGFIVLIAVCYWRTLNTLFRWSRRTRNWGILSTRIFILLVGVILLPIAILVFSNRLAVSLISVDKTLDAERHPNILLITSDGLSASHMSLYGYERDTTPRMRQLAKSSLVAENAFPNSGKTSGSIISIYTSKYPAETHLLLPPDVLKGNDSYEHLPGILHSLGYRTVQIATPYYLDANTFNLVEGFDEIKINSGVSYSKYINIVNRFLPDDKALFVDEILKRFLDRIQHILLIQTMVNPHLLVTGMPNPLLDAERLEIVKHELRTSSKPIFIHVHWLVTHGPKYKVIEQKYSAGQSMGGQALWTKDFYDDSILEFDKNTNELIDYLTEHDLLDNTLIIIGSDHGQKWDPIARVPLIIRFPHEEYIGTIPANVQNLDIAPTILDYINVDQPVWMRGISLIAGELDQRPILGMTAIDPEDLISNNSGANEVKLTSSSDNLYFNTLIYCDKWFKLDSYNMSWESGFVEGSTADCAPSMDFTERKAFQLIEEHLKNNDFDVSSLVTLSP